MFESDLETLRSVHYRRNITALRRRQAPVAEVVDSTPIPGNIAVSAGRDGSRTLRLPGDNGRQLWFGGSSMPTISVAETFADFLSDGRNVTLPGVLTGLEPLAVAAKLPPYAALFVVEREPLYFKLALHLYDYAPLLDAGRVVFVLADNLVENLRTFFESYPGYDVPMQILTVPQRTDAELAALQRRLENAGRTLMDAQARVVESCVDRLRGRPPELSAPKPRLAVLSYDTRPATIRHARRTAKALDALGWPHEVCVPDAPDRCHLAARLQAVVHTSADLVLFLNCGPGQMGPLLPADLPTASWYLPEAGLSSGVVGATPERHVSLASTRIFQETLQALGVPADRIEACGPAADTVTFHPLEPAPSSEASTTDVAVLMDLPDDRPEAAEVNVRSHVTLWQALQQVAHREVDRYRAQDAGEFLDAAQRSSGVTLREAVVRERFIALLKTRIAPACAGRAAESILIDKGCRPQIWGLNWPAPDEPEEVRRGAIPTGDELNHLFNTIRIIVIPDSSPGGVQIALDGLAAGSQVVMREPDEPFPQEYPSLASAAPYFYFYRTRRELVERVRELQRSPGDGPARAERTRAVLESEHSVCRRLESIVEGLRRRRAVKRDRRVSMVD